jgi:hypothetical protein
MVWQDYIPQDINDLYEVYDYRHAAAIMANELKEEFSEICNALRQFRFTEEDVVTPGGSESAIPKHFSKLLRPEEWREKQLRAKLVVEREKSGDVKLPDKQVRYDTHKVDYTKGRVAFDLEWNSKDQTFDRDLYAFRAFFEYDEISVGVLVTRSNQLDPWFAELGSVVDSSGKTRPLKAKYGPSTTHMGKLIPRLEPGRSGGCPVLVFGITTHLLR